MDRVQRSTAAETFQNLPISRHPSLSLVIEESTSRVSLSTHVLCLNAMSQAASREWGKLLAVPYAGRRPLARRFEDLLAHRVAIYEPHCRRPREPGVRDERRPRPSPIGREYPRLGIQTSGLRRIRNQA